MKKYCASLELSKEEKKIYNLILRYFPNTSKDSAYDIAIRGGIKFDEVGK